MDAKIEDLIKQLTLEEKVSLVSGADNWHTRAIERLGIPAIRMTDGPHGVRRPLPDDSTSEPATSFPTAAAMAATWNTGLIRKVGAALAEETKSKGCDILLGPAVNIHRAPLCGRNFEYFSEDPYLAGRMAVAYIQGLQSGNVGASLKHYAANNSEFERFTISSDVDERALREIYLPAFEAAVKEAQPWTVMCSYNKINGTWASENHYLLTDILKQEWGFEGFVVSDWGAVHHRIHCANAGLDLEMPGMGEMPVRILIDAVRNGLVDEAVIDEMVRRILRIVFMARSDGQVREMAEGASNTPEHRALARAAAGEAIVLLKNEGGLLPLDPAKIRSIAVFGPSAAKASIQGGGSAHVTPYYAISPLEGIREQAGSNVQVTYTQGCKYNVNPPRLDAEYVTAPNGEKGFLVSYYAGEGFGSQPFATRVEPVARFSNKGLPQEAFQGQPVSVRWEGAFTAPVSGDFLFSLTSGGVSRLLVDGQVVVDHWNDPNLAALMSTWPWRSKTGEVRMEAGKTYNIVIEYQSVPGHYRLAAGYEVPLPQNELERVASMAAAADVAVVCVGTTWEHETEGHDRREWDLPGEQVRLIETVARANPRTVVVLTNGSPLGISAWANRVPALLEAWFNGQETGNAIADVLFGGVNPSGKLPDTYPVHFEDNPSYINYPGENGHLLYGESIFVGYRYYDMKDIEPLYPFGYGLSYTTFAYENLRLSADTVEPGADLTVTVDVRNTGKRAGKAVVQLYVRDPESKLVRPPKELKGFQKVELAPGEQKTLTFTLAPRDLSYYDPTVKRWVAEPGVFEVLVGASSRDISCVERFTLKAGPAPKQPRLNLHSTFGQIMADPQGRVVLAKYLPQIANDPQAQQYSWVPLERAALTFMEMIPPEKLETMLSELAVIA